MAVLSDGNRFTLYSEFQREASANRDALPLTKANLRAAVDAIDNYFDANTTALNTAIPQPARGALTTKQKTLIAAYVLLKRAGVL